MIHRSLLALFSLSFLALTLPAWAGKSKCEYTVKTPPTVGWTAYKFTEKAPVKGSFKMIESTHSGSGRTLPELLSSYEVTIKDAAVNTGNPGRDKTLLDHFFSKLVAKSEVYGRLKDVSVKGNRGTFVLELKILGKTHDLKGNLSIKGDKVEATVKVDMLKLGLKTAYKAIHKACEKLHTGKDGVSKTWTEALIQMSGQFKKTCS